MSDPPGWWFVSLLVAEGVSEFFGCRHTLLAPLQLCWLCLTNGFHWAFNAISSYPAQATFSTWIQRFGSGFQGGLGYFSLCRAALMLLPALWTTPQGWQLKVFMVWNPRAGPFPWNGVFGTLKATFLLVPLGLSLGSGKRSLCWTIRKHQQL